ncbi:YhdH/YhfP family quinone oxidoreductase [Loigolactobacillus rennini]|uniref:Zinc-containing alcohol dehydrogenase (Oxidoreductase) n=1 Tax=Loigolactobacillus rennini DSM 20253 TaxID=1423796 RepID=A0A0R2CMW3_9LACO|nr:YhdH/YhfP family quinone oxidoreductase [Loigolactobacillus rennini]KRM92839.1 zinc-containing alcohol dehydrogenase (oxidoreductase) [Loigolactobacillus rennini DSM 20253]
MKYRALELQLNAGKVTPTFITQEQPKLQTDQVTIKVAYSDINHKDFLALNPKSGVLRHYPQIPGIDAAGVVVASNQAHLPLGQKVLITGFDLGISWPGGYAEYITVPAKWVVKLPTNLSLAMAMQYGTAGFTAALSVQALLAQTLSKQTPLLITGATGGVGGWALAILKHLGYHHLTAVSRQAAATPYLTHLGAEQVITPDALKTIPAKPLQKQRFGGVIDAVGGDLLAAILPQVAYGGRIALSGNTGGNQLNTTTLPFILRHVQLIGIDSVYYPASQRQAVWQKLATSFKPTTTTLACTKIDFQDLATTLPTFTTNKPTGRYLIRF